MAIPMTLNFGGEYLDVISINVSEGGALVEMPADNLTNRRAAAEGARGSCFFEFAGFEFESDILVIRQLHNKIGFKFSKLTPEHVKLLAQMITLNL